MEIKINKDNFILDSFSAIISDITEVDMNSEKGVFDIYLIEPVGYGETPLEAVKNLVDKMELIENNR